MLDPLYRLTSSALRELAATLGAGPLSSGLSAHAVQQIVGASMTAEVVQCIDGLVREGWTPQQVSVVASTIADARGQSSSPDDLFDLVLSGPDVPGIPTRDTAAVMHSLIEEAREEVLVVGYAVHDGRKLFGRLAERMQLMPGLRLWLCLNIPRKFGDTSLESEIVRRFALEFVSKHWPWQPQPELYYDPRALSEDTAHRASLHAKCLIVDRKRALITSANFTEAAQQRNIEAGVVVRQGFLAERLASYFEGLRASNRLHKCAFP